VVSSGAGKSTRPGEGKMGAMSAYSTNSVMRCRWPASMTWQITWSLVLGFTLSAVVEAVLRWETLSLIFADDRPANFVQSDWA
jgi:hypothetical protein